MLNSNILTAYYNNEVIWTKLTFKPALYFSWDKFGPVSMNSNRQLKVTTTPSITGIMSPMTLNGSLIAAQVDAHN